MSDYRAIQAVTATLVDLLTAGVNTDLHTLVQTCPPDKIKRDAGVNQLNLFLYRTTPNAAWRNEPLPNRVKPGETGQPPVALVLHYLLTAYSNREDDDQAGHALLGSAMRVLHDACVLDRITLGGEGLTDQIASVRIVPETLSVDDMSKLWTAFQTQYRVSTAYEASVVLIESRRPVKAGLPVLTRGANDEGPVAHASIDSPFPVLAAADSAGGPFGAGLGTELRITGTGLRAITALRLSPSRLDDPLELPPDEVTDTLIRATLPSDPARLPAGLARVAGIIRATQRRDQLTETEVAIGVAPEITSGLPMTVALANGTATIEITCRPEVRPEQATALIVGDRQVPAEDHAVRTAALKFVVPNAEPGDHRLRLRVDGIDSVIVNRAGPRPVFDDSQKVTVEA